MSIVGNVTEFKVSSLWDKNWLPLLFIKTERFECLNCKYRGKVFNIEKRAEINRTTISNDISDCERVFGAYVFAGECDSRIIVREWYKHRSIF